MYLVTLLVEAMGGRISLESEVGSCSTFTVLLPATEPNPFYEDTVCEEFNSSLKSEGIRKIQAIPIIQ